ncbi:MAG: hypothetical protein KY428_11015, partial [Bacteroidetes bacterium]|nr:hypothetical protein [Bacteroidota bacterium]
MDNEFNKFGDWEEAWQQAFNDAEQAPSNSVWQGLENSLMDQKLRHYRRKLFLYQWLAAASVMLLGLWAGWWAFFAQPNGDGPVVAQTESVQSPLPGQDPSRSGEGSQHTGTAALSRDSSIGLNIAATDQAPKTVGPEAGTASPDQGPASSENAQVATVAQSPAGIVQAQNSSIRIADSDFALASSDRHNSRQNSLQAGQASGNEFTGHAYQAGTAAYTAVVQENSMLLVDSTVNWVLILPEINGRKPQFAIQHDGKVNKEIRVVASSSRRETKKKQIFSNSSLWLGASLASNVFDPNMSNTTSYDLAWTEQPLGGKGDQVYTANVGNWDEKEQSRPSIDFKLDAGFRLSNRWMLQTSVKYGSYRVNTLTGTFKDQESQA